MEVEQARRQLAEAKLAAYIQRVVDEAPPLSLEQRDRLAVLLCGSQQSHPGPSTGSAAVLLEEASALEAVPSGFLLGGAQ